MVRSRHSTTKRYGTSSRPLRLSAPRTWWRHKRVSPVVLSGLAEQRELFIIRLIRELTGLRFPIQETVLRELDALLLPSACRATRPCMPWEALPATKTHKRTYSNLLTVDLLGQP